MTETQPKKSDLGVRVASAVVMIAVAGTALWLGGWVWTAFVAVVALGVLWEWWGLIRDIAQGVLSRTAWQASGTIYVGLAAYFIIALRNEVDRGWVLLVLILLGVIGTDIGAYFAGRTIGGPKIAPSISPSKTWSGLIGGILGATAGVWATIRVTVSQGFSQGFEIYLDGDNAPPLVLKSELNMQTFLVCLCIGTGIAVVAQSGDFFESWLKRRAGAKDSGKLLPGHGGLLDRTDGLIAVLFFVAVLNLSLVFPA